MCTFDKTLYFLFIFDTVIIWIQILILSFIAIKCRLVRVILLLHLWTVWGSWLYSAACFSLLQVSSTPELMDIVDTCTRSMGQRPVTGSFLPVREVAGLSRHHFTQLPHAYGNHPSSLFGFGDTQEGAWGLGPADWDSAPPMTGSVMWGM